MGREKYFGEQHERHLSQPGEKLFWIRDPAFIPLRGTHYPLLNAAEVSRLPVVSDFRQHLFDLAVPEDAEYYNWVRDRVDNSLFQCRHIERVWDAPNSRMKVYMEWLQVYRQIPPQTGTSNHGGFRT